MRGLFRASLRPVTLIPFALCGLVELALLLTDAQWVGSLAGTLDWANAGLFLGGCVMVGASSFASNAWFQRRFLDVVQARRPGQRLRVFALVFARNEAFACAVHAVVVLGALAVTAATGPTDAIQPIDLLYALLPITLAVALGTAVSAFVPHPVASAVSIAATYAVFFNVAAGELTLPVLVGGINGPLIGLRLTWSAFGVWAAVGVVSSVVLATGGAVVLMARRSGLASLAFVLALAVGLFVPSAVVPQLPDRVESVPVTGYVCAGHAPRVCLARGLTWHLTQVSEGVHRAAEPLRTAGVDLTGSTLWFPARTGGGHADRDFGVLDLELEKLNRAAFGPADYAEALTSPADCAAGAGRTSGPTDRIPLLAAALGDWLSSRAGARPSQPVPESHGVAWAREAYEALAACRVPATLAQTVGDPPGSTG